MIVLAMVTEVSMAQRVVNGINTRDAKACMEYLVNNKKDTIASVSSFVQGQDTCVVRRVVFLSATNKLMARQDTVIYRPTIVKKTVMNPTTAAALEETSVDTRFTEAVVGRDSKRDTYYAICDSVRVFQKTTLMPERLCFARLISTAGVLTFMPVISWLKMLILRWLALVLNTTAPGGQLDFKAKSESPNILTMRLTQVRTIGLSGLRAGRLFSRLSLMLTTKIGYSFLAV